MLLRWPLVALEMGGPSRAARWAGVWSTLAAPEEQILDAHAQRAAEQGKETVGLQLVDVPKVVVEVEVSSVEAGSSWPGETRPMPPLQQSKSLLVKLGLFGFHSMVPRQNPKSTGSSGEARFLGLEQTTRPAPALQQLQKLLMKLGHLGSPSAEPRYTTNAEGTAVVRPADEARPPGIAKQSAKTKAKLAESSGGAGPSWSRAKGTNGAAAAASVKYTGEPRLSRFVKNRVTSESEPELAKSSDAESSDEALPGRARPSRKETVEAALHLLWWR